MNDVARDISSGGDEPLEIEILHVMTGDKRRKINTRTASGREEARELIERMLRQGIALFLERHDRKTYRIKGYDAKKDRLVVRVGAKGLARQVTTKGRKSKIVAVAPRAGG